MAIPIIVPLIVTGVASIAAAAATSKNKPVQSSKPLQRRTKDDYAGTSFTYNKMVNPVTTVNTVNTVNKVPVVEGVNTVNKMYTPRTTRYEIQPSTHNYYNDPYQINSLADVFLNKAGRELVLQDLNLAWMNRMPEFMPGFSLAKTVIVGVDYLKRSYYDPASTILTSSKSEERSAAAKELVGNLFMGAGEDLDIIANPIKGLILDGPQGFIRGLGVGSEGRTQYDYSAEFGDSWFANTGEFIINMGAEIASDPLNWISFGGKTAAKELIGTAAERVVKNTAKELGQEITEEAVQKFTKHYATEVVTRTLKQIDTKDITNAFKYLKKAGVDNKTLRVLSDNLYKEVLHQNAKNVLKGTYGIVRTANAIDDTLLMVSPLAWTFKLGGAGVKYVADAIGERALRNTKKYIRAIDSFDGAEILDPKTFDTDNVMKVLDNERTVNYITGKRPTIAGLPDDVLLVKRWQELEMYNDGKTVDMFIDGLVARGDVDPKLGAALKKSPDFLKYYEESVVAQGSALENLYKQIDNNSDIVTSRLRTAIAQGSNKLERIAYANKAWSEILDGTLVMGKDLNFYKQTLANTITKLEKQINDARIANDLAKIESLTVKLKYWEGLDDAFESMLRVLDIDLTQLPDLNDIITISQSKNPEALIDTILNSERGYNTRLQDTKAYFKQARNEAQKVRNALLQGVSEEYNDIPEIVKLEKEYPDVSARLKKLSKLLNNDKYLDRLSDEALDCMFTYERVLKDYKILSKMEKDANGHKFISYLENYLDKDSKVYLADLEIEKNLIRQMKSLQLDVDAFQIQVDKYTKLKGLLTKDNLKIITNDKTTVKNLEKFNALLKKTNIEVGARLLNSIEIGDINIDSPNYKAVTDAIERLGLNNADVVEQIDDALLDASGVVDVSNYVRGLSTERGFLETFEELEPEAGALINDKFYTRDDLLRLQRLFYLGELKTQNEIREAIDILYELGELDFNTDSLRAAKLEMLDPSQKYYYYKVNQLAVLTQLMEEYERYPEFKQTIVGLATDSNTTPIATLFNIVEQVDTSSLIFDTRVVTQIKNDAKAQLNFTNLFNTVMSFKENKGGIREAFLDFIAGNEYNNIDTFMNKLSKDGINIDIDKLTSELSNKINGLAHSGILQNSGLHEFYGLGKVDSSVLHNAAADSAVCFDNFKEQVRRGYVKLDEGEIITVLDFEATDLNLDSAQILQFYGHKYQYINGSFVDLGDFQEIASLNKGQKISAGAARTIGWDLQEAVVKSKVKEIDALDNFVKYIGDSTLIGHNSNAYDLPLLEKRIGQELSNKRLDVLEIAKKNMNYITLEPDLVQSYANILTNYIQQQRKYANSVIKFIDKNTLNNMYNLTRDLNGATLRRFLTSSEITRRIKGNVLEDAYTRLIGHTVPTNFSTTFSKEQGQELVNTVINKLDVPSQQSLIVTMREALSDIKRTNAYGKTYYISSDKVNELAGFNTNIYAYLNSDLEKNGYVPNYYATKKLYQTAYARDVDAMYNKLKNNTEIVEHFKVIIDENSDPIAKAEASEAIALLGSNEEQAARVYYATELTKHGATSSTNLNDIGRAVVAHGKDEIGSIAQNIKDYSEILGRVSRKDTDTYSDLFAINETLTILEAKPKQLAAFMFDEAPRIRVGNITHDAYKDAANNIWENKELYKQFGINVYKESDNLYLDLSASYKDFLLQNSKEVNRNYSFNTRRVKTPETKSMQTLLAAQDEMYSKANRIRKNALPFNAQNTAVTTVYKDDWLAMSAQITKFDDALVDDAHYLDDFFITRDPKQSYINLGDINTRKMFNRYQQDPFRHAVTRLERNVERVDGRNKLIELNFNNDLSLSGPMYKNLSDKEVLDIFKQDSQNYVVLVLAEGKKGKPIVKSFAPKNVNQIARLRELDGIIAPKYYANTLIGTINKITLEEAIPCKFAQLYYKYIVSTYKTIYLASIGMLFRNATDILIKNNIGSSIDEVPTNILEYYKALKDWIDYDKTVKEIIESSNTRTFDAQTIAQYFASGRAKMSRDMFDEIHAYATSNVSAGMATAQADMLKRFYIKGDASKFDTFFFDNTLRKNTVDQLSNINSYIEHAGRLSELRIAKLKGLTDIEAYNRVLRTHFDYSIKSKGTLLAEFVMPFVTFPLYNLQYWLDAFFESPWLVELLIDSTRTSLEIEAQKQYTLDNSYKLQAALNNGNVKIGNTLFKLNPSMFDALNIMVDTEDQLKQRMGAVPKLIVDGVLDFAGKKKYFNPDPESEEYVNKNVTNLDKIGLGTVEEILNQTGLYTISRAANNVLKGVASIGNIGELDQIDSAADVVPSMFSELKQNYGARIGEDWHRYKYKTTTGTRYVSYQTKTGKVTSSKYYNDSNYVGGYSGSSIRPTTYPKTFPGRSYSRIPYVRRYYNNSYNWYNRWKAERLNPYYMKQPATPESLAYTFKGLLYDLDMNPKILRAYDRKQNQVLKVK